MTISVNSVDCEIIFSAMNYIKDKKKARLSVRKLYQRLLVYVHGPGGLFDFDFEAAYEIFCKLVEKDI